jgi:hypothetical protein
VNWKTVDIDPNGNFFLSGIASDVALVPAQTGTTKYITAAYYTGASLTAQWSKYFHGYNTANN